MRMLLSTIGSRGDVQPLVGLALAMRAIDVDAHVCVPPDALVARWVTPAGARA